jgi:hypothetical protein
MAVPGGWDSTALADFRGAVRFVRPFGYPGRIDANERVWLTIADLRNQASVTLNEAALGIVAALGGEFEITALLRPRNVVQLEIESREPIGGLWSEVALEVRAEAFLRDVRFEREGTRIAANGLVVGEAADPLELYLIAGRRCVAYDLARPTVEGQPFTLVGEVPLETPLHVKVELIDAATVWFAVEGLVEEMQTKTNSATPHRRGGE